MGGAKMRGLVFAALLVAAAGASMSSIPLFVWSGHSNVQSGATSVKAALSTHLGGSEIAMVYMLDEVSSHQMGQKKAAPQCCVWQIAVVRTHILPHPNTALCDPGELVDVLCGLLCILLPPQPPNTREV